MLLKLQHFKLKEGLLHLGYDTQAGRIIKKAGGFDRLAKLLADHTDHPRDRSCIFRWNKPKDKGGTGGHIPPRMLPHVVQALRADGVLLTPEDIHPDLYPKPTFHETDPEE
jgi:hypothetical protein